MKDDQKRAKARFLKLQRAVSAILQHHDPINLSQIGAPDDEYDPEVGTIVPRLREARNDEEVRTILHEEFVRWFGLDEAGPVDLYSAPAKEVWDQWLLARARTLSGINDVELVDPRELDVRFSQEVLEASRILRIGERYFVETTGEPGAWWMGEQGSERQIRVWGTYGSHEEAFAQTLAWTDRFSLLRRLGLDSLASRRTRQESGITIQWS
jgi:hypothetical protein